MNKKNNGAQSSIKYMLKNKIENHKIRKRNKNMRFKCCPRNHRLSVATHDVQWQWKQPTR